MNEFIRLHASDRYRDLHFVLRAREAVSASRVTRGIVGTTHSERSHLRTGLPGRRTCGAAFCPARTELGIRKAIRRASSRAAARMDTIRRRLFAARPELLLLARVEPQASAALAFS